MSILNINIGVLGHVDSGKTSLAKALTEIQSTACFDKDPQSQTRGITLDLGFSSFTLPSPPQLPQFDQLQFTLVDNPGHASLLRTVIGGSAIIDLMLLVIDANKGIQTQTGECVVIGEITGKKGLVVLNKVDMIIDEAKLEGVKFKVKKVLNTTRCFHDCPILPFSALHPSHNPQYKEALFSTLIDMVLTKVPRIQQIISSQSNLIEPSPLLVVADHCFAIKGKGTVLTGTVLRGQLSRDQSIFLSCCAGSYKVKSIQAFKRSVNTAHSGDRIGIRVANLPPQDIDRVFVSDESSNFLKLSRFVVFVNKVAWFKNTIESGQNYHVSIGYETVIGKITLFKGSYDFEQSQQDNCEFLSVFDEQMGPVYALVELSSEVVVPLDLFAIFSRLDFPESSKQCRIAFSGKIFLPKISFDVFRNKVKKGVVKRVTSENSVIVDNLFNDISNARVFLNCSLKNQNDDVIGLIESTFGQSGKVVCRITGQKLSVGDFVFLHFKRSIFGDKLIKFD
ncbi:hypothetical protein RCL1_004675 [Eukaryota sp. TZLM3-RCL]